MNETEYTFPPSPSEPLPEAVDASALPHAEPTAEPSSWGSVRSFLRETLETIALTLIIFVVIRAGVQNFRIEGYSMEPNFHDGQYLLISKIDYLLHTPERGDVIVFTSPQNPERDFIKRVIGLPGDTVDIREGKVFVDGKELPQTYNVNPGSYNFGPAKVGPDQLFVLGDNRNNSSDSHSWGMLPRSDIIGKAWISYWPPQLWALIQSPSFAQSEPAPAAPPPTAPAKPTVSAPYPSY
ncbi:MAG: signal peptidase I [Chloroflexota bacterium]